MDPFPTFTGSAGPPPTGPGARAATTGAVMAYFDGNTRHRALELRPVLRRQRQLLDVALRTVHARRAQPHRGYHGRDAKHQCPSPCSAPATPWPTASAVSRSSATPIPSVMSAQRLGPRPKVEPEHRDLSQYGGRHLGLVRRRLRPHHHQPQWVMEAATASPNPSGGFRLQLHRLHPSPSPVPVLPVDCQPLARSAEVDRRIGRIGPATDGRPWSRHHHVDSHDFFTALNAGNLPAVVYVKAPAYPDGHAGYSDPVDEQAFASAWSAPCRTPRSGLHRAWLSTTTTPTGGMTIRRRRSSMPRPCRPSALKRERRYTASSRTTPVHCNSSAAESRHADDPLLGTVVATRSGTLRLRHTHPAHGHLAVRQAQLHRPHAD